MKVKTWVRFDQEVDVEIDPVEAMRQIVAPERDGVVMDMINGAARALKAVDDIAIDAMNDKQRETIRLFLQEQVKRFYIYKIVGKEKTECDHRYPATASGALTCIDCGHSLGRNV